MLYGYCRISKKTQSIDRQIRNIKAEFPEAHIVQEAYTGRKINRPEWIKLNNTVKSGDVIVFDSVSRMSRNAAEGVEVYFDLIDRGVSLITNTRGNWNKTKMFDVKKYFIHMVYYILEFDESNGIIRVGGLCNE